MFAKVDTIKDFTDSYLVGWRSHIQPKRGSYLRVVYGAFIPSDFAKPLAQIHYDLVDLFLADGVGSVNSSSRSCA